MSPRIMRTSGSALFASSTVKYLRFFSTIGLAGAMCVILGKIDESDRHRS